MRNLTFTTMLGLAALTAGCASHQMRMGSAAGDVSPALATSSTVSATAVIATITDADVESGYNDATLDVAERVRILDARAATIDVLPLTLSDVTLEDNTFSDVTDERWASMEMWYDGTMLNKIRMVPGLDRDDTEEFYYDHGKLIMAYWNPNGVSNPNDYNAKGSESFYFGAEGLISWVHADGSTGDPASADFAYWDNQLRKEALRFQDGGRW